jgi:hypothetical protein
MGKTGGSKRFNTFTLITSLIIVFEGVTGRSYIYFFAGIIYFIYNLIYRIRNL